MTGNGADESIETGSDLSRIVAFSDGVFAVAITLLVLQIEVPGEIHSASDLWQGLHDEGGSLFAYALSFAVIGGFWISHHQFMRTVDRFDRILMLNNIGYLAFVVLMPFFSDLIAEYGRFPPSVILYALNLAVISVLSATMSRHVVRASLVRRRYREYCRLNARSALFTAAVFAISSPLAFLIGPWVPATWVVLRFDPFQKRRDLIGTGAGSGSS